MRLAFKIATRFLFSNKSQTLLIALGIAIGISVQIFIGSLIEGLQVSLIDATIGRSSHVTLLAQEKNQLLNDTERYLDKLEQNNFPITAQSLTLNQGAFFIDDEARESVLLKGIDPFLANPIYDLESLLVSGQMPKERNEILIGNLFANDFALKEKDTLTLFVPDQETQTFTITGIFDFGVAQINSSWLFASLSDVQSFLALQGNQFTQIELQIEDPFNADEVAQSIFLTLDDGEMTYTQWKKENEQLLTGLTGQSTSSFMIQFFVIISVVLGIASVLAISVLQKSRQIGILKAMGVNNQTASYIFLFQGAILGIIGGLLGILIGLGLLYSFTAFALNPDGTPVVPIVLNPYFIGFSGMVAVLASMAASIIPALKSKNLSPIEVIRNG